MTLHDSALSVCIAPMHTRLPGGVSVHGGITRAGDIIVDRVHDGTVDRVTVGRTRPDDHNASAVHVAPGHLPVVAWNTHGHDDALYVRTALTPGDVPTAPTGWLPTVPVTGWPGISYSQIHYLPSRDTTTGVVTHRSYLVLCRSTLSMWRATVLTVDQLTGDITWTPPVPVLDHKDKQGYLLTATAPPGGDTVRFAAFTHYKRGGDHTVRYGLINLTDLTITSPGGPVGCLTTGAGLPLTRRDLQPVFTPPAGWNSWPLAVRGHPAAPGMVVASWHKDTLTGARYHHLTPNGSSWVSRDLGPVGAFVGARQDSAEQYTGGACYPSPANDRVWVVSEHAGSWALTEWTEHPNGTWTTRRVDTTRGRVEMYRPRPVVHGVPGEEVAYRVVDRYAGFTDYLAHIRLA